MDKLLPCPFCGSKGKYRAACSPHVTCTCCGTSVVGGGREDAIMQWNTRKDTTLESLLEKVPEYCDVKIMRHCYATPKPWRVQFEIPMALSKRVIGTSGATLAEAIQAALNEMEKKG